jgi:short-subunit dehydrogenase
LVERPKLNIVGTKWVFRNKQDEHGVVTRNKARLVSIRILLAYATNHGFKLYQIDVKKKSMWSNLRDLKRKNNLFMCINSIRYSMSLIKLLEYGMNDLGTFSLTMILGTVKLTQLFSQEK